MTSFPRGAELLRQVLDSRLLDVHTALPCEVRKFNATAKTIDCQPMIKNVLADGTEESYPLLRSVPVIYPRSGAFIVAFPLVAGDLVTVIFHEWSIDHFVEKGKESHPIELQRHAFSGAVAFPGGPYSKDDPITETLDGLIVGNDGGAIIRVKDDGNVHLVPDGAGIIHVGSASAAQALLLGTLFRAQQTILHTALGTAFGALATGWTAVGTFAGVVAADAHIIAAAPAVGTAAGVLATAAGVAATAMATAATAITTFEGAGGASNYLSTKAKTVA